MMTSHQWILMVFNWVHRGCIGVLVGMIRGYQLVIAPYTGHRCRFSPTCSVYAIGVLQSDGVVLGSLKTIRRLLSCHPFHPGGVQG